MTLKQQLEALRNEMYSMSATPDPMLSAYAGMWAKWLGHIIKGVAEEVKAK